MVVRIQQMLSDRSPNTPVGWVAPLPMWARPGPTGVRLRHRELAGQPAILRFDHDDFMDEYLGTLQHEPERLGEWVAVPETWREPMRSPRPVATKKTQRSIAAFAIERMRGQAAGERSTPPSDLSARVQDPGSSLRPASALPLKLYQAAHKRHYLITASLISELPGLSDWQPALSRQEKVSFVVRRLMPPEDNGGASVDLWDEYAFVPGAHGNIWYRVGRHDSDGTRRLISGEEQIPMFSVAYQNRCRQSRHMFSGTIPVSRREQWVGAEIGGDAEVDSPLGAPVVDASRSLANLLLQTDVVSPWKRLLEQAENAKSAMARTFGSFDHDEDAANRDREHLLSSTRDEIQTGSWYVLLDFAVILRRQLPDVWQVLKGQKALAALKGEEQALVLTLQNTHLAAGLRDAITTDALPAEATLADALVAVEDAEAGLEAVETAFTRLDENVNPLPVDSNWPRFVFPLADPKHSAPMPAVEPSELRGLSGLERRQAAVDVLARMVASLLPTPEAAEATIDTVPLGDTRSAWFVVRCVYERPNCGPLFPPLVSAATEKFLMAPFFDPDAPTRPVRIQLPVDISPAGLRKFQKNAGFVISGGLCGKIKRIQGFSLGDLVRSVLPWPLYKGLDDPGKTGPCKRGESSFGMICSLSIPIVTLCALMLLIVIASLFNQFFRWIPLLFQCKDIDDL